MGAVAAPIPGVRLHPIYLIQLMLDKAKNRGRAFCIILGWWWAAALSAQQPLHQDELALAQQWLAEGRYTQAFEVFQSYAQEKQHPLAQFTLALFYQLGWGREIDETQACQWHGKAAEKGVPAASHFFAECLHHGIHQPADYPAAMHWYQQAANLGHAISLCAIAELVIQGKSPETNRQKALQACEDVAAAGSIPAQLQLGRFYLMDDPSLHDPQKAATWYGYAAEKGISEASYHLGVIHRDIFDDSTRALYWFETAASQGYIPAYYPTANLYFMAPVSDNTGMPRTENLAKAYLWLLATERQSAQADELQAVGQMLGALRQIMPASWEAALDQKVAQHLQTYHPTK